MLVTVSPSIRGSSQLGLTKRSKKTSQVVENAQGSVEAQGLVLVICLGELLFSPFEFIQVLPLPLSPHQEGGGSQHAISHGDFRDPTQGSPIGRLEKEFDTQKTRHPEKQLIIKYEISTIYIYIKLLNQFCNSQVL